MLWKTVYRCLKKLKIELPYGPTIPILESLENKSTSLKRHMPFNVRRSIIYNCQLDFPGGLVVKTASLLQGAHGDLHSSPGIAFTPPAAEAQSLNHWTAREVSRKYFLRCRLGFKSNLIYLCLCTQLRNITSDSEGVQLLKLWATHFRAQLGSWKNL